MSSILKIRNLKARAGGKKILKGIDLDVKKGEIQVILGPNASGKSTLAHVISGNPKYKVTGGEIVFNGKKITGLSPEKRVKLGIALSWQNPPSIKGVSFSSLLSVISQEKKEDSLSESLLGREVNSNFSGGEKKISELVQVLSLKPKLVIFDEIDSGLDMKKIGEFSKIIKERLAKKGVSLILITHSGEVLKFLKPDLINVMVGGKIVCKQKDSERILKTIKKHGYERCREKSALLSDR
jgi:Fe-S cluster assembly ATP-binding protein